MMMLYIRLGWTRTNTPAYWIHYVIGFYCTDPMDPCINKPMNENQHQYHSGSIPLKNHLTGMHAGMHAAIQAVMHAAMHAAMHAGLAILGDARWAL